MANLIDTSSFSHFLYNSQNNSYLKQDSQEREKTSKSFYDSNNLTKSFQHQLDSFDKLFLHYLANIEKNYVYLNKQSRIRVEKWIIKLIETSTFINSTPAQKNTSYTKKTNKEWKRIRNNYAKLLLDNLIRRTALESPFNILPPEGDLPSFPSHLISSRSSAYPNISPSRFVGSCNSKGMNDLLGGHEISFWTMVNEKILNRFEKVNKSSDQQELKNQNFPVHNDYPSFQSNITNNNNNLNKSGANNSYLDLRRSLGLDGINNSNLYSSVDPITNHLLGVGSSNIVLSQPIKSKEPTIQNTTTSNTVSQSNHFLLREIETLTLLIKEQEAKIFLLENTLKEERSQHQLHLQRIHLQYKAEIRNFMNKQIKKSISTNNNSTFNTYASEILQDESFPLINQSLYEEQHSHNHINFQKLFKKSEEPREISREIPKEIPKQVQKENPIESSKQENISSSSLESDSPNPTNNHIDDQSEITTNLQKINYHSPHYHVHDSSNFPILDEFTKTLRISDNKEMNLSSNNIPTNSQSKQNILTDVNNESYDKFSPNYGSTCTIEYNQSSFYSPDIVPFTPSSEPPSNTVAPVNYDELLMNLSKKDNLEPEKDSDKAIGVEEDDDLNLILSYADKLQSKIDNELDQETEAVLLQHRYTNLESES